MHLFVSISTFFKTFRIKYSTKGCLKMKKKWETLLLYLIMQLQPIKIMRQHFIALFFSPLCNWPINRRKCTNIRMHSSKFQDICSMKSSLERCFKICPILIWNKETKNLSTIIGVGLFLLQKYGRFWMFHQAQTLKLWGVMYRKVVGYISTHINCHL